MNSRIRNNRQGPEGPLFQVRYGEQSTSWRTAHGTAAGNYVVMPIKLRSPLRQPSVTTHRITLCYTSVTNGPPIVLNTGGLTGASYDLQAPEKADLTGPAPKSVADHGPRKPRRLTRCQIRQSQFNGLLTQPRQISSGPCPGIAWWRADPQRCAVEPARPSEWTKRGFDG